jgi:hypothetical protein
LRATIGFIALALVWGYAASVVGEAAHLSPAVAPASMVLIAAAFGWTRRDGDILDVVRPGFAVSFAAFAGLALARSHWTAPKPAPAASSLGPLVQNAAVGEQWPLVILAGLLFAVGLTILIALPVSLIPVRRKSDPHAHDALWQVVAERNARALEQPRIAADDHKRTQ